jgi:hypothetical protein
MSTSSPDLLVEVCTNSLYERKKLVKFILDKRSVDVEASMAAQYVRQKLEMGRVRVWHDVQSKVAILISACESSNFKFDDFLNVLDLVDR